MPELPEVETLKLGIQKYVVGHKILDVELAHPKIFQGQLFQGQALKIKLPEIGEVSTNTISL